ncbi:MAG: nitrilase-related carbon-nitrogen hydrolase, partial [Bdellovibrionales bacterium]
QVDRPEMIITITNDAWYGDTPGPYQHYMMARYRAIEEGVPVLRSANTGISGGFDALGRDIGSLGINKSGYIDIPLVF